LLAACHYDASTCLSVIALGDRDKGGCLPCYDWEENSFLPLKEKKMS
jgi:hypothetical protein